MVTFLDTTDHGEVMTADLTAPNLSGLFPSLTQSRSSLVRIAVDPGKKGAIALLDGPDLIDVRDMPIRIEYGDTVIRYRKGVPYEKREEFRFIDADQVYALMWAWTKEYLIDEAIIEDVTVTFGHDMSKQAALVLGQGFGIIEGAAAGVGLAKPDSLRTVTPSVWKRKLGVTADKRTSLDYARELWPKFANSHFKREKDNDRAEAALIGYYAHITCSRSKAM
jgi:hypothetical protein